MKKILLLLCTLLGTVGAWADVTMPTLTTDTDNPVLYGIQSFRSYGFVQYAGDAATPTQTLDYSNANTKFYFVSVNGTDFADGVKIVSNINGKQLNEMSGFAETGTTWYIKENPYKGGFFCISKTSDLSSGCWDCNASGSMSTGFWAPSSSDNDGTSWQIVSVEDLPQYEVSTLADPKWYYIQSGRNNRYLYADGTTAGTTTDNPKTDAYKFAFISAGNNAVQIVSKAGKDLGSNMYISTAPGLSNEASTFYYYNAAQTNGWFNLAIEELEQNGYTQGYFGYLKGDSWASRLFHIGNEGNLTKWYGNGVGNNFRVEEVLPVCNVTYTYTYGGQTYTATEIQNIGDPVSLPASITFPYTTYSFSEDVVPDASTATINVTVISFTTPFMLSEDYNTATWYYLHGHASYSNYYVSTNDAATVWNTTFTRDNAHKWAFTGNPIEGIKIINKASGEGKYLTDTDDATSMTTTATNWTIRKQTAGYSNGAGISFGLWSTSKSTYANCAGGTVKYWTSFDQGSTFWIAEEVDAVTSDKNVLSEAITAAQALVDGAGNLGYPVAAAATTLNDVLTSAKSVYADAAGDYGSAYNSLVAAIQTATASANINYIPRTDVYYTITSNRGSMVYDSSHDESVDADGNKFLWYTNSLDDSNVNHLWGFIEKDGNYYMYNVGKKQFATVSTSGSYQLNDKGTWVFSDAPAYVTFDAGINNSVTVPYVRVRATVATTGTTYSMSISTSYTGPVITYDAQGDGGIPMTLATSEVTVDPDVTAAIEALLEDLTPYRNALKDVIDGCADLNIGTGLNQYASNSTYTSALSAANSTYNNAEATKSELQTAKNNLSDAIKGLVLNLPGSGFYRIKGKTNNKYLAAGLASNSKFNMSEATDATTVFYFDGYQLINLSSGMSSGMTATAWAWVLGENASTVVFSDGETDGGYVINSADAYFYDGGTSADRGSSLGADARYRSWYLEEVTTLPVTISAAGYATLYAPVALTIPEGVTASTVTINTDGVHLDMSAVSSTIPANTPVILSGEAGTYNFVIASDVAAISAGALTGASAAIAAPNGSYILQNQGGKVGFYLVDTAEAQPNVPGFRAYIAADSDVKAFYFGGGEDAIKSVADGVTAGEIYNLAGQRISQLQRGVNIVSGKKVVVK